MWYTEGHVSISLEGPYAIFCQGNFVNEDVIAIKVKQEEVKINFEKCSLARLGIEPEFAVLSAEVGSMCERY